MRISRLLFITTLFMALGGFSPASQAADGAIKVKSIAQVEVEVVGKDGKKTLKRAPVEKVVPGTEVIYTTTFENIIDKTVGNIAIDNPVPNDTEYKAGSAFGKDCEILFSADGGKKFGHAEELKVKGADGKERTALPREYTNIRWNYKGQLAAGKSGEVGFRAVVK
ncbi:MAG: hypothetical protein EPN14_03845 [Gallionella sp.]|nr:MAG: hypothetical protein EPN14_03845 [Gallionella sp.]